MADNHSDDASQDATGSGRRTGDRRQKQVPFDGPDRRKGERRSGTERRADPRHEGTLDTGD